MEKIITGNDFRLIVDAQKMENRASRFDLNQLERCEIYLVKAGRARILQSYTLDDVGRAIIDVDGDALTTGTWGVEIVGTYLMASIRSTNAKAFQIVDGLNNGGMSGDGLEITVEVLILANSEATRPYVDYAIAEHDANTAAHPTLQAAIDEKVADVKINGTSVVDDGKVANVTMPTKVSDLDNDSEYTTKTYVDAQVSSAGRVDDVEVNGTSVLDGKTAKITMPTKTSDLSNDSDFATNASVDAKVATAGHVDDVQVNGASVVSGKVANVAVPTKVSDITNDSGFQNATQVRQAVDDAIAANLITGANVTIDSDTGTPSATVTKTGNNLNFAFHKLKGYKGDKGDKGDKGATGDSAIFDPSTGNISTMKQTTGDDELSPMSQKAITETIKVEQNKIDSTVDIFDIHFSQLYDANTATWLDGYYRGSLQNFTADNNIQAVLLDVIGGKKYSIKGRRDVSNMRVFDEDGVEIVKSGGAYFPSSSLNGDFIMPTAAAKLQVVVNTHSSSDKSTLSVVESFSNRADEIEDNIADLDVKARKIKVISDVLDINENGYYDLYDPDTAVWLDGYYIGTMSEFVEHQSIQSTQVDVVENTTYAISGRATYSHMRVFDGNGVEITRNGGAYFKANSSIGPSSINGNFTMPVGAETLQIVVNTHNSTDKSTLRARVPAIISNEIETLKGRVGALSSRIITAELIGESLKDNGEIDARIANIQDFKKTFTTNNFLCLNAKGGEKIDNISVEDGESFTIYQYNKQFALIATAQDSYTLNDGCSYVKISVKKTDLSQYEYSKRLLQITLTVDDVRWVKNGLKTSLASPNFIFHTYEIEKPFITDYTSEPTTSYRGHNGDRLLNRGYIVLPPNYSRDGKPVPVIVHCHGTSGYTFNSTTGLPYNTRYIQFLAKCGYAVIGCSSLSELYQGQDNAEGDLVHPLGLSCYENLWKYMTSAYNIDNTGAYIFGYSAGGMYTTMLSQLKVFPIRCCASLAGSLDMFANLRACNSTTNGRWFEQLGCGADFMDLPDCISGKYTAVPSAIKELFLSNLGLFKGYNAFLFNSDLDYSEYVSVYFDVANQTSALEGNQQLVSLISQHKVHLSSPMKIWHAVDDANVPIAMSRFYAKMVRNGGGICLLRELPAGVGAHYAVGNTDHESGIPMMDYITPFGETINVPVAYAEMVDWFKRW